MRRKRRKSTRVWLILGLVGVFGLFIFLIGGNRDTTETISEGGAVEKTGDAAFDDVSVSSAQDLPESFEELPVGSLEPFSVGTFVPYWSSFDDLATAQLDQLWYFGIVPTVDGIDQSEPGYAQLSSFMTATADSGNTKKFVTLRMVDSSAAAEIMSTAASWQKIADQTKEVVAEYGFDGVVLNLEVGLQAFASSETDITSFATFLSDEFAKDDLPMLMTLYGDTEYRARPYNLSELAPLADQFLVMTYDFHKSFGLPGPNFPLAAGEQDDYDLRMMLTDLTAEIPAEKLTIVLGMYGYSWSVDDQGRPLKPATAMTVFEVANVRSECEQSGQCAIERDPVSAETEIRIPEDDGRTTVIWYEDQVSASRKVPALQEAGVNAIGTWAWGYYDHDQLLQD